MHRSWSVGLAVAAALVMVGCGAQKPAPAAKGQGTAKGVVGQYFYVNLFTPPVGGTVTSDVGGIACGASSLGTPVADAHGVLQYAPVYYSGSSACGAQGQTRFSWSQTVTLTAAPEGTNAFITWAGDCAGSGPTCILSAGADKTVVAVFGPPGSGHSTPFPNRDHAPAYFRFLGNDPTAPRCTTCHGQNYGGQGIAPSCNACHASAGWANWQQSCSFCHGLVNATTKAGYDFALHPEWAAPPHDVNGRVNGTDGPAVGAHQAHVATNAIRAPIGCSECHVVPAAAIHFLNHTLDLPFGPLSKSGGAVPTWNPTTLTCGANYCHGNFKYGSVQGNAASLSWGATLTGCTACHGMPPTGHIPVGSTAASCSGCHPDTVLPNGSIDLAKGRHINGVKDMTGGACDSCHWFPYPSAAPPPVPFQATGAHLAHYGLVGQGTTGYGDLDTLEVKFPTPPPPTSAYAFGCGNCHPSVASEHSMLSGGATAKVVLFESNLAPALKSKNAPNAAFGGTCSGVYCHGNVAATPAWNANTALACNACHGTGADPSGAPSGDSHVLHVYTCNTCHGGTTTDGATIANTALHVNGRPDLSPGAAATFTYTGGGNCSNISCHFNGSATWGTTTGVKHLAALGTGDIPVFNSQSNHDVTPLSITENCTLCHAPSLVTQHASKCDICHSGSNPAGSLINNWNKGCSTGACHPSIHQFLQTGILSGANHFQVYDGSSASCDRCHDTSGGYPGPGDFCARCHSPELTAKAVGDHLPPTTITTAVNGTFYTTVQSFTLTATDDGTSGVSSTWWSLDGKAWELGTSVYVGLPTSGIRAHTLQFFSVDHALNAEVVKVVTFTMQGPVADTTPPVTTSSFNPAAGAIFATSRSVTLSATDNASGVQATYYRIDAGALVQGISFTVTDGVHTFSYYSVDNANNTEATHASNSFRVDTVAPVTTSSAVNGTTYTGAQTFTLAATDTNGSGVASTWYILDFGAVAQGTSVAVAAPASGSAPHTIQWYSRDVAGNQEATKSATFTIQAPVADATPPVTTSSFNPAVNAIFNTNRPVVLTPTDPGSGVLATYYRIDAGAFIPGVSFTVSGDGLHTFSYYSVDNVNNIETTHVSNQFRIDTVAPVTANSAVAGTTYTGNQTFTLTPTDSGSSVASTSYSVDGALPFTAGTSILVAAPASGSVSHTIQWFSLDVAGNQETTKSVTFTVQNAAAATPVTLVGSNSSSSSHPYTHFWVNDSTDTTVIADSAWSLDEHITGASFVVPAGVGYVMHVEWEYPDYEGGGTGSASRQVTPAEAAAGATVTWALELP